ncbi:zeta toxin family protein [Luethyella okanaganae]|uniref:UDP-N-acetylglucosamine kinase n=1 Tax=Luethyella okanaganae TaxID=69372 RepID=A0ABW1VBP7_9MICO
MIEPDAPSEARLRQVFDAAVRGAIFTPVPAGDRLLVLLGGQPAAGKMRAQAAILAEHPELVSITGDDLRAYHPGYRELAVDDPLGMPAATAPTSSGLIRLALDHAIEHGYPALLEGTFRDPTMVTGTAARFAEAGYRVEVVAALEALPAVTRIQVYARDRRLYDNHRTQAGVWEHQPHAAEVLRAEQTRQLTPAEAVGWLADYGAVFGAAHARRGYFSLTTAPAYWRLQDDAAGMIELARDEPSADKQALEEQQAHRRIALKAAAPEPSGIVGRVGQTLRRSLPPYRPAPSRDAPGHEPPSYRTLSGRGTFAVPTAAT